MRQYIQSPDSTVMSATTGITSMKRRFWMPAITFAASGPASLIAGPR